mmetsp:Transcript_108283/g.208101  ORF Transcript_108283/g.208101 Transcript_108283/m.208101 type:complete len:106 (+) Transcript_108283:3-320(+)
MMLSLELLGSGSSLRWPANVTMLQRHHVPSQRPLRKRGCFRGSKPALLAGAATLPGDKGGFRGEGGAPAASGGTACNAGMLELLDMVDILLPDGVGLTTSEDSEA